MQCLEAVLASGVSAQFDGVIRGAQGSLDARLAFTLLAALAALGSCRKSGSFSSRGFVPQTARPSWRYLSNSDGCSLPTVTKQIGAGVWDLGYLGGGVAMCEEVAAGSKYSNQDLAQAQCS